MSAVRACCIGALFSLMPLQAQSAESAKALVQPLGEFSTVRATEDHTYGYRAKLWLYDNRLIGQLTFWDGNIEGRRGSFTDGVYDRRTGNVKFKVTVVRRDVQPNTKSEGMFEGVLLKNTLSGKFSWLGKAAESMGEDRVAQLAMPFQAGHVLTPYANVEAWRKALVE